MAKANRDPSDARQAARDEGFGQTESSTPAVELFVEFPRRRRQRGELAVSLCQGSDAVAYWLPRRILSFDWHEDVLPAIKDRL
jgi:hypothetical protein